MWELPKEQIISDPSVASDEVVPPICFNDWERFCVAFLEWELPNWVEAPMRWLLGVAWRRWFPCFVIIHFIHTGEWYVTFHWFGGIRHLEIMTKIFERRMLKATR